MTLNDSWVPDDIDITVPSVARVYDYLLGGGHNFAADRKLAAQVMAMDPSFQHVARISRAALGRMVQLMAGQGIRQFLDIGSGIPTVNNVHEIAREVVPDCRVAYVDRDPVAVAHSELLLADDPRTMMLRADIRQPEHILDNPDVNRLIDFDQPVGLLFLMMLHWVPDADDPQAIVGQYRDRLVSGSYLAITHVGTDHDTMDKLPEVEDAIRRSGSREHLFKRDADQVRALFGDFDLLEPGIVGCGEWRPNSPGDISDYAAGNQIIYAGVGRKP
ncbi:hypothetical protein D5S17_07100 [Pseudonocardiaceae bacterium YIM PH 21723]|nr:hypothetical protein D5S17_07100 [Pseudonocardiaceae bacterium YIM PH 21723]